MAVEIRARLNAEDQVKADALLGELAGKTSNLAGGLKIIGEALLKEQNKRFETQTSPDGKPWEKLKPLTVATRGGATGPILRRRGHLMRSGAWQLSGTTLRVGVNTIYAGVQHFGATIVPKKAKRLAIPIPAGRGGRNKAGFVFAKKVTIPPRPIVGFGPKDELATRNAIADWLALPGNN
ncbi:MAG: phage virion morphogenesis protein [Proteobacteria bacterium]|nr:phage virion morphogenesis protein [Pseudomonadota bacterium]